MDEDNTHETDDALERRELEAPLDPAEERRNAGADSRPGTPVDDPLATMGESLAQTEAALFPATEREESRDSFSDAKPFASKEAPWVGAEEKWLTGAPDLPAPPAGAGAALPSSRREIDDDLLVPTGLPAGHSLAPLPPKKSGAGAKIAVAVAVLVVAAAAGVIYWLNARFSAREQQILAMRASDKEEMIQLERQIRELLAKGGAENEQLASALEAQLHAKQEAAAEAAEENGVETEVAVDDRAEKALRGAEPSTRPKGQGEPQAAGENPASSSGEAPGPAADDKPSTAGSPGQGDDDEDLLDRALSKSAAGAAPAVETKKAPETPVGGTELPERPSREQVTAAMDSVAPQVKQCGPGSGRVVVSVVVAGATGRVTSAEPTGDAAGTALGLCAARAVKLAKFPPFAQSRLSIKYPFEL